MPPAPQKKCCRGTANCRGGNGRRHGAHCIALGVTDGRRRKSAGGAVSLRSRKLTEERAHQLQMLPGWTWDPNNAAWCKNLDKLSAFLRESGGRYPSDRSHADNDERRLGQWVCHQREAYKGIRRGGMTDERISQLNRLLGWAWSEKQATPVEVERNNEEEEDEGEQESLKESDVETKAQKTAKYKRDCRKKLKLWNAYGDRDIQPVQSSILNGKRVTLHSQVAGRTGIPLFRINKCSPRLQEALSSVQDIDFSSVIQKRRRKGVANCASGSTGFSAGFRCGIAEVRPVCKNTMILQILS